MASYVLPIGAKAFDLTGLGGLKPFRLVFAPLALRLTGKNVTVGKNLALESESGGSLRLERLNIGQSIVDSRGYPSPRYQLLWQQSMEAIEAAFNRLSGNVTDLTSIVEELARTQELASQAQSAATAAAQQAQAQDDLRRTRDSYVEASPLSATNSGGTATITVAAHQRNYLDPQTAVSVNGGTINGLAAGTTYFVFYDDPQFAGGAVSYQATTSQEVSAASSSTPYRHSFAPITTPSTSGGGTTGEPEQYPEWYYDGVSSI